MRIFVACLIALLSPALASGAKDVPFQSLRFQLYVNCEPLAVAIDLHGNEKTLSLTQEQVQNVVESRLRGARIYTDDIPPQPAGLVNIRIHIVGWAYQVRLEFLKFILDYLHSIEVGVATTWTRAFTGYHAVELQRKAGILSATSQLMDSFLVEYFRANEAACEKQAR